VENRTLHEVGKAGIGLRGPHIAELLTTRPALGGLEVHPENYLGGGAPIRALERLRCDYSVNLHGVGLSLGSADGVDAEHLGRLRRLADRIAPAIFSEHLAWSVASGIYVNDLLPLPYTEEALAVVCRNVETVQDRLGRPILVENPSSYLRFRDSTIPEHEFLAALARRTGCGILCDVNNIYVSTQNFRLDPIAYIDGLPPEAVGEIHLSGHFRTVREGRALLIDDHGDRVAPPVWALYRHALRRFPRASTIIEWDRQIPDLAVLIGEARQADAYANDARAGGTDARAA
jgi:uncharacterized protein (UPF0276 family)